MGAGREGLDALLRAHSLWLHGPGEAPAGLPALPTVRSTLRPAGWWFEGALHPLGAVKGEIDVAVGVARPERFLCALLSLGLTLRSCRLVGDHRPLGELPAGCVVTEKDAARLPPGAPVRTARLSRGAPGAPGAPDNTPWTSPARLFNDDMGLHCGELRLAPAPGAATSRKQSSSTASARC
jgi:hypothetical protein